MRDLKKNGHTMPSLSISNVFNVPCSQSFITTFTQQSRQFNHTLESIIQDSRPSVVAITREDQHIMKLIKPRSWHEYFKLFWRHSRYHKEIKGNLLLRRIGLQVPEIYETGIGLIPAARYGYLGFYIMENLEKRGFKTVLDYFEDPKLPQEQRQQLFDSIVSSLEKMRENLVLFNDLHLRNIMATPSGDMAWIDTGVTHFHWYSRKKFQNKFRSSVSRLINCYDGSLFSQSEQQRLKALSEF